MLSRMPRRRVRSLCDSDRCRSSLFPRWVKPKPRGSERRILHSTLISAPETTLTRLSTSACPLLRHIIAIIIPIYVDTSFMMMGALWEKVRKPKKADAEIDVSLAFFHFVRNNFALLVSLSNASTATMIDASLRVSRTRWRHWLVR